MFPKSLITQATTLLKAAEKKGIMIATAESCTGGLIAALLTEIPGSSRVVERGFVTYANEAKAEMLSVPMPLIARHGAVSAPVAKAMAKGALQRSNASLSVAVTGIAGPAGGSKEKPVGLVYIAVGGGKKAVVTKCQFKGSRASIRLQAVRKAISLLKERLVRF